ncbi:hypothetical protein Pan216_11620 [Planctomycetes bacterium Pan216]|uniref:Secreted protein n=1 Tax=Kolteria novifilia TaxID=2527975 RepID=A0A518B019_9BACT|nr:hypothetical protein Pan216_11620 [Planctomycetes bacterium Pan216]
MRYVLATAAMAGLLLVPATLVQAGHRVVYSYDCCSCSCGDATDVVTTQHDKDADNGEVATTDDPNRVQYRSTYRADSMDSMDTVDAPVMMTTQPTMQPIYRSSSSSSFRTGGNHGLQRNWKPHYGARSR